MPNAVFDFPYHSFSTDYPDSSFRVKLGNSYEFSAPPTAPDQRIFNLKFPLMKYFVSGGAIDLVPKPKYNLGLLEAFYNTHKLYKNFTYPHPVYGNLTCKFNKPLKIPTGKIGGDGAVENIELELVEVPL